MSQKISESNQGTRDRKKNDKNEEEKKKAVDHLLPSNRAPGRAFPLNIASVHPPDERRQKERERRRKTRVTTSL